MTRKVSPRADLSVCARIRRYRVAAGLTQGDVAQRVGISKVSFSMWERGINQPSQAAMPIMAEMFGCKVRDFFEDPAPADVAG